MLKQSRRVLRGSVAVAALTAALSMPMLPGSAKACSQDGYQMMGTICVMGFDFCPKGYAPADGRLLQINSFQALYSLLGTTYGGNGRTTFALPDLRGRFPIGVNAGQTPLRYIPLGLRSGSEYQAIQLHQMPTHTHEATGAMQVSPSDGTKAVAAAGDFLGAATVPPLGNQNANLYTGTGGTMVTLADDTAVITVSNAGGSQPLPTYDPSLGMTYCIAIDGTYPMRN